MAIYCPQGSGTLRQQYTLLYSVTLCFTLLYPALHRFTLLYSALLGYSRFHRNLVRTKNPHFYFKAALRDSASSQSHSPLNNPRKILKPNTRLATLVHNWYSQGVCFKVCCRIQKCPKDLTNSCLDPVEKGGQVREKGLAWGISLGSGIPTTWKDFQNEFH